MVSSDAQHAELGGLGALWRSQRMGSGPTAVAGAVLIILLTASPLAALVISVFTGGVKAVSILADSSILWLIARTMLLAALATLWAMILGLPPAWILTRTDLPGRRMLLAVAVLPLAIPPYIGAFTYITLLGPVGWVNGAYQAMGGSGP